ncbi:hypothetical protein BH09PAT4_BH09PAT4_09390 [soil metagenome]
MLSLSLRVERRIDSRNETNTLDEAAYRLGISRGLAYRLAKDGEFPVRVIRLGHRYVVSRHELDAFLHKPVHDNTTVV